MEQICIMKIIKEMVVKIDKADCIEIENYMEKQKREYCKVFS